jgi:hypothetical protein
MNLLQSDNLAEIEATLKLLKKEAGMFAQIHNKAKAIMILLSKT